MKKLFKKVILFIFQIVLELKFGQCKIDEKEAREIISSKRKNGYKPSFRINKNKEKNVDLSIIVPVYNTEKYIGNCIKSVVKQKTNFSFELLLVNDGSTDQSLKIMESFRTYNCVKIINQENRGFSGARNRGIDEANGKFLMFLDSDDMLCSGAIEKMMNKEMETDAEIIEGGYVIVDQTGKIQEEHRVPEEKMVTKKKDCMKASGFFWNKLYKREIFDDIRLPEGVLFEDTLLHMIVYPKCKSIYFLNDYVYQYRLNNEGISNTHEKGNRSIDTYWVVEALLKERKELGLIMDDLDYKFLMWQLCIPTIFRLNQYSDEIKKSIFVLAAGLVEKNRVNCFLNYQQKMLEKAYLKRNYSLWKIIAKLGDNQKLLY